jgi:hypothetical protein
MSIYFVLWGVGKDRDDNLFLVQEKKLFLTDKCQLINGDRMVGDSKMAARGRKQKVCFLK